MIDVIIATHKKDLETLEYCIQGIKDNIINVGRIITISDKRYTENVEWVDESVYGFTKVEVGERLEYPYTAGWYYQQLLKLYAWKYVPKLSTKYLHIDSDIVFMKPVKFIDRKKMLYDYSIDRYHEPYYIQMLNMHPTFKRAFTDKVGETHHILYYNRYLKEMMKKVKTHTGKEFWQAFCDAVPKGEKNGSSELEIYFNYVFNFHKDSIELRKLEWIDTSEFNKVDEFIEEKKYDFMGFHAYSRCGEAAIYA